MNKLLLIAAVIAIGYGAYYYHTHPKNLQTDLQSANDTKNALVTTTEVGLDTAVKSAVQGIDKVSPLYYYKHRSYGNSETENICRDTTSPTSVGAVVSVIQTYTKAVSCTVDNDFPSKSFTLVAPSLANKGQYYCTDQSGYVGLIPDIITSTSAFKAGFKCK